MLFDGKLVREENLKNLKKKFQKISVGLTVVQVGDDFASNKYIAQKEKLANELGVRFQLIKLETTTTKKLCKVIDELNEDENVHGIIVQLPLPKDIDYEIIRNRIAPDKDVDGVNDVNVLRVFNNHPDALVPCTALGIMKILDYYKIPLK
jgi:methylenetetrahydrofolate dehydrogenase (NADP+)/methenyltetrahydrofolate cyclohydrolase